MLIHGLSELFPLLLAALEFRRIVRAVLGVPAIERFPQRSGRLGGRKGLDQQLPCILRRIEVAEPSLLGQTVGHIRRDVNRESHDAVLYAADDEAV